LPSACGRRARSGLACHSPRDDAEQCRCMRCALPGSRE
jgi:hypothetical protein